MSKSAKESNPIVDSFIEALDKMPMGTKDALIKILKDYFKESMKKTPTKRINPLNKTSKSNPAITEVNLTIERLKLRKHILWTMEQIEMIKDYLNVEEKTTESTKKPTILAKKTSDKRQDETDKIIQGICQLFFYKYKRKIRKPQ